jgi:hypothetical protein
MFLILWPCVNSQNREILVGEVSHNCSDDIWTSHVPVHFQTLPNWGSVHPVITLLLLLLQSALQPLVGFQPAQLSLSILSRKVLQTAVASGKSNPQLGGEPGI